MLGSANRDTMIPNSTTTNGQPRAASMSGIQRQNQPMPQQGVPMPQGANSAPPGPQGSGPGVVHRTQDDTMRMVADVEREIQCLTFGESRNEMPKKIWDDDKAGGDAPKTMFHGGPPNPWASRDDSWSTNTQGTHHGGLGVTMAEYVLGGSPVGKDFHPGMKRFPAGGDAEVKQNIHSQDKIKGPAAQFEGDVPSEADLQESVPPNGILQNGLEDDKGYRTSGSRQNSPTEGDVNVQNVPAQFVEQNRGVLQKPDDLLQHHPHIQHQIAPLNQVGGLQLDTQQFEPVGIDPFPVDYSNQLMPPSMDSPNFNPEYNQQLLQRQQQQQQQPIAVLTQQQYLAVQQQQLGLTAITPSPYVLNAQDPYSVGIPVASAAGPAVVPQYYGVQTPWGIYPAANILQQGPGTPQGGQQTPQALTPQQQLLRGQNQRPVTPQSSEAIGTPSGGVQPPAVGTPSGNPGGYQILTPAYYDANGQLVMSNGRGVGTPVRLVSPAPILVNTGQQGLTSQRRDSIGSLDYKQRQPLPQLNQYYSALGQASTSPAGPMGLVQPSQSLTPPSSLSGSNTNLAFTGEWGLGTGRLISAAPGAEAKYRNSGLTNANGLFGTSLFTPRIFAKSHPDMLASSASLTKEVTGRSRLLEDFRNNRIPNLQLKDLVNHVVEFSQDQHGSRFIQQKLERATPPEKAMVFNEILSAAYSLMTDVFGNYVIQKFFEFGTQDQKQTLAQRVRGHVLHLALQMYGCRVIQKALESIPPEMQIEIVKELDSHVLKCVKDQNGNHVVQKCIECVEPKGLSFIIDAFKGQVFTLSTHPYGCRVIQRILEHCLPEQTNMILDELHSHTERLVQDQYGNYVIQHVLEHGRPDDKSKIVVELRGKVLLLSQHKFASNVVEKCVSYSSRAERALLIEEVCSMNDGPHSALYTMMKDQFANYVVQKMIDVADPPQRKMLITKIRPHVTTLRKFTYGKHILAKLEKFYMKNNADLGPIGMPPNGALP